MVLKSAKYLFFFFRLRGLKFPYSGNHNYYIKYVIDQQQNYKNCYKIRYLLVNHLST